MARHAGSPSPSPIPSSAAPSPSPCPQQLTLQLRHDFARLVDKDPDARRSAMDSLKAFVEGELNSKSMPCFLDQVSSESGRGEPQSHTFAISLFVEVARVHKQMTIPYIPRIMATVVRSLSSGAGAQNLHHACAKVVAAVARYALDPSASSPVQCEEVFRGLCHPLLSVLTSKLEPVAMGSATCLQALVESEKWRLAPLSLVNDACCRAAAALGGRGTQTVAHMHLVRSLAKFNPRALQEYGLQLLKTGAEIMTAAGSSGSGGGGTGTPTRAGGGGRGSWQQRAAAAQLLGMLLASLDQRVLASGLLQTIEALEQCRLDKVTVVRQAVGEALATAKSLASHIDPLLLKRETSNGAALPQSSPSRPVPSDARRQGSRRKSLWRADEFSASSESKDDLCTLPGSQESQLISHGSPPTISSSPLVDSPSPPSSASSNNRIERSPLYPAKQSPALMPSSIDPYTSESEWEFILARLKSSELKENTPLVGNKIEPLLSAKPADLSSNNSKKENGGHFETMASSNSADNKMQQEELSLMSEDCVWSSQQDSVTKNDLNYIRDKERNDDDHGGGASFTESSQMCSTVEGKTLGTMHEAHSIDQQECHDEEMSNTHYNSLAHMVNLEDVVSPQVTKTRMTTEDFLIFATPRRLVRSLQSVSSTPDSKCTSEQDLNNRIGMDIETLSESGWSVRDNPMAGESEDDSPRESLLSLPGTEDAMSRSWDSHCLKGSVSECSVVTQVDELPSASASASTDISGSVLGAPLRCRQLFGTDGPDEDESDQSEQIDKSSFCQPAGIVSVQNISATSLKSQAPVLGRKQPLSWLRSTGMKVWALSSSKWDRIHRLIEQFLSLTLVVVLVFPIAIATLNCLNGQSDLHVLVPT